MKSILFILFTGILYIPGMTQQQSGWVRGKITSGNRPLEAATVILIMSTDSASFRFTASGRDGSYFFEQVPHGSYRVSVSASGHISAYSEPFEINSDNLSKELEIINMMPVSKSMAAVVVTARKPLVEHRIDRMVINVEAAVTNVGTTALEVLEKAPGVTVDKDGRISLKGKEGVLVMVDGRPTYLSGEDLANLLRNMNASQVDQIEIMTNPPARYDAAGNAGVINIRTKKNRQTGYNGNISTSYAQGYYPKFYTSASLNYRHGKLSVFSNFSHNYRLTFNNLDIWRNIRNQQTKQLEHYFDQQARMRNEFNSFSARAGLDYSLTPKTTLGVIFSGYSNPGSVLNRNSTLISDPFRNLESITLATVDYRQKWENLSTNLNFRSILDTAGRELTADLDYISYDSHNDQLMINSYYNSLGNPAGPADTLMGRLPQSIDIFSGRVDYIHPLKNGARFESGIKSSLVRTDNNAIYDSVLDGREIRDLNRSNHFIYREQIRAGYVNLNYPFGKKLTAQMGLRMENTLAKGRQVTTGQDFERNYTQLFPTAYLRYTANEKHTVGINYGRRIRRPNYQSLNPFIKFLDRYTFQQGNPDLNPQFSHNIEFSHTFRNFLTTTLNYSRTDDIIEQVIRQKGQEVWVTDNNIAEQRQFGFAVSGNIPVTKWWSSNIYVNIFNNRFSGLVDSLPVTVASTTLALNGSQQFKFAGKWTAELSGFFRTAGFEGVMEIGSMGMLNAGVGRQLFSGRGTIRLSIRDILLTQRTRGISNYGNVDISFRELRDSRLVSFGFSYRFSKGKAAGQRKRNGGSAADEQNRVGAGN